MSERVYPSARPNGGATLQQPSQFAPPYHPTYHPAYHAGHDRRRCTFRRCFFLTCCWFLLFLIFIILLSCMASAAIYFLYNPKRPTFSISSLKLSQLNLSNSGLDDSTRLTTKFNLTLSCKNPNKKIIFYYDTITIKSFANEHVLVANGTFPGFTSVENNVTTIHTTLSMVNQVLDPESVTSLRSDLKKKIGVPIKLVLETKVKVKMDKIKVKKFDIVVTCQGIYGQMPKGKIAGIATITKAKCKVDPKFKIWKVTF
ncbi:hypothetical protein Leryth_018311 [Lithospermum erythrorhizon]|nr:hypothetical protein Leryth_018311 [Lithospermum erythrorhizon]